MGHAWTEEVEQFICSPQPQNTTIIELVIVIISQYVPVMYICNCCIQQAFSQNYFGTVLISGLIESRWWIGLLFCTPLLPLVPVLFKRFNERFHLFVLLEYLERYVINPLICLQIGYHPHAGFYFLGFVIGYTDVFLYGIYCHCMCNVLFELPKEPLTNIYVLINNFAALFFAEAERNIMLSAFLVFCYELVLNALYWRRMFIFQNLVLDFVFHCVSGGLFGVALVTLLTVWIDVRTSLFMTLVISVPILMFCTTFILRRYRINSTVMKLARLMNYISIASRSLTQNMALDASSGRAPEHCDVEAIRVELRRETHDKLTDLYYQLMSMHIGQNEQIYEHLHGYTMARMQNNEESQHGVSYSVYEIHEFLQLRAISALEFNTMYLWLNQISTGYLERHIMLFCKIFQFNPELVENIYGLTTEEQSRIRSEIATFAKISAANCLMLSVVEHKGNFEEFAIAFLLLSVEELGHTDGEQQTEAKPSIMHERSIAPCACEEIQFDYYHNAERECDVIITVQDAERMFTFARRCINYVHHYILFEDVPQQLSVYDVVAGVNDAITHYDLEHSASAIPLGNVCRSELFRRELAGYQEFAISIKLLSNHLALVSKYITPYEQLQQMIQLFMLVFAVLVRQELVFEDDIAVFASVKITKNYNEQAMERTLAFIAETVDSHENARNFREVRVLLEYVRRLLHHKEIERQMEGLKSAESTEYEQNNYYYVENIMLRQMHSISAEIRILCEFDGENQEIMQFCFLKRKIRRLQIIFKRMADFLVSMVLCEDCLNIVTLRDRYDTFEFRSNFEALDFRQYTIVVDNSVIRCLEQQLASSRRLLLRSERWINYAKHQYEICVNLKFKLQYEMYLFVVNREVSEDEYAYVNQLRYIRGLMNRFLRSVLQMISSLYRIVTFDNTNFPALFQLEKYLYDLNFSSLLYELIDFVHANGADSLRQENTEQQQFCIIYVISQVNQLYNAKFKPARKMSIYCKHFKHFSEAISMQDSENRANLQTLVQGSRCKNKPYAHTVDQLLQENCNISIHESIFVHKMRAAFYQLIFYKNRFFEFLRGPSCLHLTNNNVLPFESLGESINAQIIAAIKSFNKQKNYIIATLAVILTVQWIAYVLLKRISNFQVSEKEELFNLENEQFDAHMYFYRKDLNTGTVLQEELLAHTHIPILDQLGYYVSKTIQQIFATPQLLPRKNKQAKQLKYQPQPIIAYLSNLRQEDRCSAVRTMATVSPSDNNYYYEDEHGRLFEGNIFARFIRIMTIGSRNNRNLIFNQLNREKCENTSFLTCLISYLPRFQRSQLVEYPSTSQLFTITSEMVQNSNQSFNRLVLPQMLQNAYITGRKYRGISDYKLNYQDTLPDDSNLQLFPFELRFYEISMTILVFGLAAVAVFFTVCFIRQEARLNEQVLNTIAKNCYFTKANLFPYFLTGNRIFSQFRILNRYADILRDIIRQQHVPYYSFMQESELEVNKDEFVFPTDKNRCESCGIKFLSMERKRALLTAVLVLFFGTQIVLLGGLKARVGDSTSLEAVRYNSRSLLAMTHYQYTAARKFMETRNVDYLTKFRSNYFRIKELNCTEHFSYDFCIEYGEIYETFAQQLNEELKHYYFFRFPGQHLGFGIPDFLQQIYADLMSWRNEHLSARLSPDFEVDDSIVVSVLNEIFVSLGNQTFEEFMDRCDADDDGCPFSLLQMLHASDKTYRRIEEVVDGYFIEEELSEQQRFYKETNEYSFVIVTLIGFAIAHLCILTTIRSKFFKAFAVFYALDLAVLIAAFCLLRYEGETTVEGVSFASMYTRSAQTLSPDAERALGFQNRIFSGTMLDNSNLTEYEEYYLSQALQVPSNFEQQSLEDFLTNQCNETASAFDAVIRLYEKITQNPFVPVAVETRNNYAAFSAECAFLASTAVLLVLVNANALRSKSRKTLHYKYLLVDPFVTINVKMTANRYELYASPTESVKYSNMATWRSESLREQTNCLRAVVEYCVENDKALEQIVACPPRFTAIAIHTADKRMRLKPARVLVPEESNCFGCYLKQNNLRFDEENCENTNFHSKFLFTYYAGALIVALQAITLIRSVYIIAAHYRVVKTLDYYIGLVHMLEQWYWAVKSKPQGMHAEIFDKLHYYVLQGHTSLQSEDWIELRRLYFRYHEVVKDTPGDIAASQAATLKRLLTERINAVFAECVKPNRHDAIYLLAYLIVVGFVFQLSVHRLNTYYSSVNKLHCSICEI